VLNLREFAGKGIEKFGVLAWGMVEDVLAVNPVEEEAP
jgi:hypothetical protein